MQPIYLQAAHLIPPAHIPVFVQYQRSYKQRELSDIPWSITEELSLSFILHQLVHLYSLFKK